MNIKFKNKNNLVLKNRSIADSIKILNKLKHKTLVVIDKKNKLFGTLTDGDIRRGILKGYDLKAKISNITFRKPQRRIIGQEHLEIINKENANVIPCVDKFNKVKFIEIYKDSKIGRKNLYNIEIILMAGGFGKRLMPLTKKIPKPLLKIGKKSLLEISINNFNKYGFNKFYISTFYKSKLIKKYFKKKIFKGNNIKFLDEKSPLGTAGCLSLLNLNEISENILISNGDIITDLNINNLIKFHIDTKSDITVCAKEYANTSPFGQIFFKGHKIKKIVEKPREKNFINAGIYIMKKEMIKNMVTVHLDMTNFIEKKISQGKNVNIYPIYEYWVDIGKKETFKQILKKNLFK